MITQQGLKKGLNEYIPHFRYQISSEIQIVILNEIIASEKSIELHDLICYSGNVINEFTNFTIYLKTNENSYDSESQGYFCQSDVMYLMTLQEYEQKYQENGFYIRFQIYQFSSELKNILNKSKVQTIVITFYQSKHTKLPLLDNNRFSTTQKSIINDTYLMVQLNEKVSLLLIKLQRNFDLSEISNLRKLLNVTEFGLQVQINLLNKLIQVFNNTHIKVNLPIHF